MLDYETDDDDEMLDIDDEAEDEDEDEDDEPCEFGIDFETGQLTGGRVYGADALAVWAWLALQTPRYACEIFTDEYGNELTSLIGTTVDLDYVKSEAERMVTDCVTVNEDITGIDNFSIELDGSKVSISFTLLTEYGESDVENVTI